MISSLDIIDILTTNSKNYKRHGNRPAAADIYKDINIWRAILLTKASGGIISQ